MQVLVSSDFTFNLIVTGIAGDSQNLQDNNTSLQDGTVSQVQALANIKSVELQSLMSNIDMFGDNQSMAGSNTASADLNVNINENSGLLNYSHSIPSEPTPNDNALNAATTHSDDASVTQTYTVTTTINNLWVCIFIICKELYHEEVIDVTPSVCQYSLLNDTDKKMGAGGCSLSQINKIGSLFDATGGDGSNNSKNKNKSIDAMLRRDNKLLFEACHKNSLEKVKAISNKQKEKKEKDKKKNEKNRKDDFDINVTHGLLEQKTSHAACDGFNDKANTIVGLVISNGSDSNAIHQVDMNFPPPCK